MKLIKPLITATLIFVSLSFINCAEAQKLRPPFEATTDPSTWLGVAFPLKMHGTDRKNDRALAQSDFDYAAKCGVNVIRLAVHADPKEGAQEPTVVLVDKGGKVIDSKNSPGIADMKAAVAMAGKVGIKVIIDMHAAPNATFGKIFSNQADWDVLADIWKEITQTFKNNPNVIGFDLMNEPKILAGLRLQGVRAAPMEKAMFARKWSVPADWAGTPKDYNFEITKIIKGIRSIDPNRTVIVEGYGVLGNPSNFVWMKPIDGFKNVVYSAHIYQPIKLTMIGMGNFKKKDLQGQKFIYPDDMSAIEKAFAPLIAFHKKYDLPIYIGEFGISEDAIYGSDSTGQSYNGSCWMTAIINYMAANNFGWTYWDFWHKGRLPVSTDDPRYIVLSAAMKHQPIPDFCKVNPIKPKQN